MGTPARRRPPRLVLSAPALLVAAALAALTVLAAPVARAASLPSIRGVTIEGGLDANTPAGDLRELDLARRLGANTVRVDTLWGSLEPSARGQFDGRYVARLDALVAAASARGLKVLPAFRFTPCWASTAPASLKLDCSTTSPEIGTYPPGDPADYANAAAFIAQRYRGKLAALEVWNEPDLVPQIYWRGPDIVGDYAKLLRAAYPAIKAVDPGLPVLGGSLVGANGNFLRALYAHGIKGSYDAIAVHPYDLVLASIRSIEDVQHAAGDRAPLWVTEFGWTSCSPRRREQGGHACVTTARQATDLSDVLRGLRGHSEVKATIVYNLHDLPYYQFGLVTSALRVKPAFAAVKAGFAGRAGPTRRPTLRLSRRGGAVFAAGTVPGGDVLLLQGFRAGASTAAYRATLRPDPDQHYRLRLPGALAHGSWVVQALQPWTGRRVERRL